MRFEQIYWGVEEPIAGFRPDEGNVFLLQPSLIARVVLGRSVGDRLECDGLRVELSEELAESLDAASRVEGHDELKKLVKDNIVLTQAHRHGQTHYMRRPAVLKRRESGQNIPLDSNPNSLVSNAFYERSERRKAQN